MLRLHIHRTCAGKRFSLKKIIVRIKRSLFIIRQIHTAGTDKRPDQKTGRPGRQNLSSQFRHRRRNQRAQQSAHAMSIQPFQQPVLCGILFLDLSISVGNPIHILFPPQIRCINLHQLCHANRITSTAAAITATSKIISLTEGLRSLKSVTNRSPTIATRRCRSTLNASAL